jgi:hypothetical protein
VGLVENIKEGKKKARNIANNNEIHHLAGTRHKETH